jgi:hypothetical protein
MAIGPQGAPAQEHALQNSLNNEDDVSGTYRCCPHRVAWYERIAGIKGALGRLKISKGMVSVLERRELSPRATALIDKHLKHPAESWLHQSCHGLGA